MAMAAAAATARDDARAATPRESAAAGAIAGGVTRVAVAPLDLIKIRFQVQQAPIAAVPAAKYAGVVHAAARVVREEGVRALWRGNLAATALWAAYGAAQFSCYSALAAASDRVLGRERCEVHAAALGAAQGAAAAAAATALTYPLDLLRTVLAGQGEPRRFTSAHALAAHLWAVRGARGLFSGLPAALLQVAPYMGLSFGLYVWLGPQLDAPALAGGAAGMVAKLAVYPLDTLKKRMQMRRVPRAAGFGVVPMYASTRACLTDVLRREGVRGLYKGTAPSLLKAALAHGATFAGYEAALRMLRHPQLRIYDHDDSDDRDHDRDHDDDDDDDDDDHVASIK